MVPVVPTRQLLMEVEGAEVQVELVNLLAWQRAGRFDFRGALVIRRSLALVILRS